MKWQRFRTESGADLWLLPMLNVRNVSFGVLNRRFGSRKEKYPEEAGIAHALEHMFFEGSEADCLTTQKDISVYIESVGGRDNAYTSLEETFYFHKITSGEIERSIRVLGESLYHPRFPEEVITVQMDVVLNELKESQDDPFGFLRDLWTKNRFSNHSLSQDPLGLEESIKSFKREDFVRLAKTYYHPDNFVYIAVGNVETAKMLSLVNGYFPKIDGPIRSARKYESVPEVSEKQFTAVKEISQAQVFTGAAFNKRDARQARIAQIFSAMIGGGSSFPLFLKVRAEKGYCYGVWSSVHDFSDTLIFGVGLATSPGNYEPALDLMFEVIDQSKNDKELLERAKKLIRGNLDLVDDTMSILMQAARRVSLYGYPLDFEESIRLNESITIEEVEEFVKKNLTRDKFYTGILLPK